MIDAIITYTVYRILLNGGRCIPLCAMGYQLNAGGFDSVRVTLLYLKAKC